MDKKIEISSIWEDDSLLEIKVFASNGLFSGTAYCYTNREEIETFSKLIAGFPKSLEDKVQFSTGKNDTNSYFTIALSCTDGSGHVNTRVKVHHLSTFTNEPQESYISEFDIEVEPASIDEFSALLLELSKAKLGEITAVLYGKP